MARHKGFVPVVRLSGTDAMRAQLEAAASLDIPVALVVAPSDVVRLRMAGEALQRLHDPSSSFLIVDSGYVRNSASHAAEKADAAFGMLSRSGGRAFDSINRVAMSGSFPSSSLKDLPRRLAMEELVHHQELAGSWSARYGDHASLPLRTQRAGGNVWFPHIDLALSGHWNICLDDKNSDPAGYVRAAKETVAADAWSLRTDCWGTRAIPVVADGNLTFDGVRFTVPGP